jgi:hypothetical protein
MTTDHELLNQIRREELREVIGELLEEQRTLEAARQRAREQEEREALAQIRRSTLTPKQVSQLVDRLGLKGYLALKW